MLEVNSYFLYTAKLQITVVLCPLQCIGEKGFQILKD
jgi:hypothetical protein